MRAINRFLRLFRQPCDLVSVEKIKEDQIKIRGRLDNVRATLNGEEGWFLTLRKSSVEKGGASKNEHID